MSSIDYAITARSQWFTLHTGQYLAFAAPTSRIRRALIDNSL